MNELVSQGNNPVANIKASTDVAGACKEIVSKTAIQIQGVNYVRVEGWMAIATAHGCNLSAGDVKKVDGGYTAKGYVKRITDGLIIGEAEGFVGEDETSWFGGEGEYYDRKLHKKIKKMYQKKPDYAIRAFVQTRAMSRAARSVFAHVVVLMDAGLSTTPAEEMDVTHEEKDVSPLTPAPKAEPAQPKKEVDPNDIISNFCKKFDQYLNDGDIESQLKSVEKLATYKPKLKDSWGAVQIFIYEKLKPLCEPFVVSPEQAMTYARIARIIDLDELQEDFTKHYKTMEAANGLSKVI